MFIFRLLFKMILTSMILGAITLTILYFIPKQEYKDLIAWFVKSQTEADFKINGDLQFTPLSENVISMKDVDLTHTPGGQASLNMNFEEIAFKRSGPLVDTVILNGADLIFTDPIGGTDLDIAQINAITKLPISEKSIKSKGDLVFKGQKINYNLKITDPEALGSGGESGVLAKINTAFMNLDYDGVHTKRSKKGDFKLNVTAISMLTQWLTGMDKVAGDGILSGNYSMNNNDISTLNGKFDLALENIVQNYTDPGLKRIVKEITGNNADQIKTISASFDINDGILSNRDLKGIGPTAFQGEGSINLINQTINYKLSPELEISSVSDVPKLSAPILITGSLTSPKVSIDAAGAIKNVVKKPEKLIKAITDVTKDNADGKQIKKDLQDFRDNLIKNPELQKELLQQFLGGGAPQ